MPKAEPQQTNLVVLVRAGAGGKAYWDARWRYRYAETEPWKLVQRRLGWAWQEQDESGRWRKRHGRCADGWLDERAASVAAVAAMEAHASDLAMTAEERQSRRFPPARRRRTREPLRPAPRGIGASPPVQARMRGGRLAAGPPPRPPARCRQPHRTHFRPGVRQRLPGPRQAVNDRPLPQREASSRGAEAPRRWVRACACA
jgi:hypothetical protein